jgi:hypothetical protein
VVVLCSFDSYP